MSILKEICFIIIGFIFLPSNKADTWSEIPRDESGINPSDENLFVENYKGISADYFFGEPSLRTKYILSCKGDEAMLQTCYKRCGHSNFRCIYNKCVCFDGFIQRAKPEVNLKSLLEDIEMFAGILRSYMTSVDNYGDEHSSELLQRGDHPGLRHHIAHFCPDLEVARTCIRTCMKVGKPAFCGKDHVCYCGHRYTDHDEDKEIDLQDMHLQFRDLYEKYFGTSAMESMKDNQQGKPTSSSEEIK